MREWKKSIKPWLQPRGDFEDKVSGELFMPHSPLRSDPPMVGEKYRQDPEWLPFLSVRPCAGRSPKDVWLSASCQINPVTRVDGYIPITGFVHGGPYNSYGRYAIRQAEESLLLALGMTMLERSTLGGDINGYMSFVVVPHSDWIAQFIADSLYLRCRDQNIYIMTADNHGNLTPGGIHRHPSAHWL